MTIASLLIFCTRTNGHVEAAVSSALLQTVPDIEVILVNPSMSESASDLIRRGMDSRIKTSEASGVDSAVNAAISRATGENIVLLGADDLCAPNLVAAKLEVMRRSGADVVFSLPDLTDERGELLPTSAAPPVFEPSPHTKEEIYARLFHRGDFLCTRGALISRRLLERGGEFHPVLQHLQGFEYWRRVAPFGRFEIVKDRYVRIRYGGEDLDRSPVVGFERGHVYRCFFDSIPRRFIVEAFAPFLSFSDRTDESVFNIERSLVYLTHRQGAIQLIGIDKLLELASKPDMARMMQSHFNIAIADINRYLTTAAESAEKDRFNEVPSAPASKFRAGLSALRRRLGISAL